MIYREVAPVPARLKGGQTVLQGFAWPLRKDRANMMDAVPDRSIALAKTDLPAAPLLAASAAARRADRPLSQAFMLFETCQPSVTRN